MLKSCPNLVIVAGHSGCGKSATDQHVALIYRGHGWKVRPVDTIEVIIGAYASEIFTENKIVFVYHDPIGKESYNEFLYTSWVRYEQRLKLLLKKFNCF